MGETESQTKKKKRDNIRTLIGFWLLGLCNNFGYVVMLSAAHDLLSDHDKPKNSTFTARECNDLSTGAILLADIVPSVIIKLLSPFFPLWIHIRMAITVVLGALGFVLVACKVNYILIIVGVVLTSLASGLGESSLLMFMPYFRNKNVVSTWSSGTGGAGVLGSLSYLGLIAAGVDPSTTIYIMLIIPALMAITFWVLIVQPDKDAHKETKSEEDIAPIDSKWKLIWRLFYTYMLPFALVYLFEYFINQGLSELVTFHGIFIGPADQYRWYSFDYQIGVLISRSTVNLFKVNNTWLLAALQGVNVVLMLTEAMYRWMSYFWVVIVFILWEGLLGGCSYVNTYRRINEEVAPSQRYFAMSLNSFGDAIGITLAGLIAIPAHNAICHMPVP